MSEIIQKSKQRIKYLDVAKGIAIILVVFGHVISVHSDPLQVWIYSFHIPAFFIISGMIYSKKLELNKLSMRQFICKRAIQILYPYFVFGLIFLMRYTLQIFIGSGNGGTLFVYTINLLTLVGVGVLWFLSTLFLSECIFGLIMKHNTWIRIISFVVLLGLTIVVSFACETTLAWNDEIISAGMYFILVFRIFSSVVFLMIGYYTIEFVEKCNKSMDIIFILILLPVSMLLSQLNGDVDLNKFVLGNPIIYYITAIIGSGAIIFISKLITNVRLLIFYGKNSLLIMATHTILGIYKISPVLIGHFQFLNNYFYIQKFVILTVTLIFETVIVLIINKYCEFLIKMPSWIGSVRIGKKER
ncbi:MAG: acyltransferase family protein [Acetobacterium sp.]